MDEKKLHSAALRVWLELNSQLKGTSAYKLEGYLSVILILLNAITIEFSDGDIQKRLEHYEIFLKMQNGYINYLKKENEN